jgi:hypothetical protein
MVPRAIVHPRIWQTSSAGKISYDELRGFSMNIHQYSIRERVGFATLSVQTEW